VFAACAKKEVFGTVDIDMVAGPSEILVMADDSANPEWVAADLLSQAEHGSGFEAAICVTDSPALARQVAAEIAKQTEGSPRRETVERSLLAYGRILVVKDWAEGVAIANRIAPEHLELMVRNMGEIALQIENAGAVFFGPYSSEPVGDYFAGPDHVLPTNGSARFASPLGVYDFIKRTSVIGYPQNALKRHGKQIAALAEAEGFWHHAMAVKKRL
jgi:histidinol dehydrogenase